ncbi:MAG: mandelate racemase/muconate lactonizing enzyme family protein [Bryobacterales bacterium]|nr:mandelate racemase/muconate lactonizing enzyme family protein [Bryobacterales bacterium]
MKITNVQTTLLTGPSTNDRFLREARRLRSAAFIEIHTDAGITGVGETYAGYFCPEVVPSIVDFFAPVLIGAEAGASVDELWRRMYHCGNFWCRVGLGVSVLNGIEAALWDLQGKMRGVPVYELLGGRKHDRLPAYATGGPSNYPLERLAEKADYYLSLGFRGFKVATGSYSPSDGWYTPATSAEAAEFEGAKVDFLRRHCGPEIRLMLDGHMGNNPGATWTLDVAAAACRALEPFDLFFFEEPLHYTDPWGYAELCRLTSVPIAGGECLTAAYEWRVFAEQDCFDIGQPDASFTGGLGEFLRVAAMLDARGRGIATHSWGAAGSLMQNVHCGFAAPNTRILEVAPDFAGLHADLLDGSFVMRDGYVLPPDRPGLGIVLTDEIKARYPFQPGSGEFNSVPGKILRD